MPPLKVVKAADLRRALEVTDGLGLHREAVRVSLEPKAAGEVRIEKGQLLVSLPDDAPEAWLDGLAGRIAALEGFGGLRRSG